MRFCSFNLDGAPAWGVVMRENVIAIDQWPSLRAAIAEGALESIEVEKLNGPRIHLDAVQFRPLIGHPSKIICVGLNYENHRVETGRALVPYPTIFTRFGDSQTAHGAPILLPPESVQLDYEGELAVVVSKPGRRISSSQALEYVAGYSCYNDASIRDWQAHTIQFGPGKNWPQTGAFGPWLVTPDEFGDIGKQRIQTRLNGLVMQDAFLEQMIFSVPKLIEYISTFTALMPGDVIVSGTPGGVGAKRIPQIFMKPGDRVEVEIDGIGILSNGIVREG
jgi:2-keto-4-pentenoate hydratase/2-oxohepta-3-ene-1,7-dioic acid hydratase in catechol pathway